MKIDILHTGDGTVWLFEVYNSEGVLVGCGTDFSSKIEATENAMLFCKWYIK